MTAEALSLDGTERLFVALYFALWTVFAALGARRFWVLWLYGRARRRTFPSAVPAELPAVTVQLPIYNERYVVRRLLRAVAALDWPADRLEVQVLDDSDDETVAEAADEIGRLRSEGLDIVHVRRPDRRGYKAGALAHGLARAKGDLLLIFDADFVPAPDLLRRVVPYFSDERVGMVQVRWGHLNPEYSLLARVQAISLDGHFVVEHEARSKNGLFFNFNGTAGVWRRRCIEEAGGWQHDTLTEDLDLSWRAQLAGWRFVFLGDVTCPAELPVDMRAFKSQQFRWVKGSVQVARKLVPRIWRSPLPLARKLEATVHLAHNATYLLVLLLSLLVYPAVLIRFSNGWFAAAPVELVLFLFATVSVLCYYGAAVAGAGGSWRREARYFPAVMSVAIGLSVNNSRAIVEGLLGRKSPFHRTPKYAIAGREGSQRGKSYAGRTSRTAVVELGMAAYYVAVLAFALRHGLFGAVPFVLLFLFGYLWVGARSVGSPGPSLRRP